MSDDSTDEKPKFPRKRPGPKPGSKAAQKPKKRRVLSAHRKELKEKRERIEALKEELPSDLAIPPPIDPSEMRKKNYMLRSTQDETSVYVPPDDIQNDPFHWRNLYKFRRVQLEKWSEFTLKIDLIPTSFFGITLDALSNECQKQIVELVHRLIVDGLNDQSVMEELQMPSELFYYVKRRIYLDGATEEADKTNLDRYLDHARFVSNRIGDLLTVAKIAPESDKGLKCKLDAITRATEMRHNLIKLGIDLRVIDKDEETGANGRIATTKMSDVELQEYLDKDKRELAKLYQELRSMGVSVDDSEDSSEEVDVEEAIHSLSDD